LKELERIRGVYRGQERFRKNLYVKAVLNPGNRKFTLIVRDGKYRVDAEQYLPPSAQGKEGKRWTIYRLNDRKYFYAANDDGIAIGNLTDFPSRWRSNQAGDLYKYYMPRCDEIVPVDEFCDYFLEAIRSHKEAILKAASLGQWCEVDPVLCTSQRAVSVKG